MVFFQDEKIIIRDMQYEDAQVITDEEIAQGYHITIEKYKKRLLDRDKGKCFSLVAEYFSQVAGYVNIYPNSKQGPFANMDYPQIVDLGVLEKYRNRGIGNILMSVSEKIAKRFSDIVYLAVGLHNGYGSAQRMYIKRGYIPDGSGVWYKNEICTPYRTCKNDDDLVLYMSKKI